MSYSHTFSDPATGKTCYFYGYLFDCHVDTPSGYPYRVRLDDDRYCNHPNSRDYGCSGSRDGISGGMFRPLG